MAAVYASNGSAQVAVSVALVEARGVQSELTLSGNVVATRRVAIGSEVAAQVAELYVEVGDVVEQGQPLLQLQSQPGELALAVKKAQLKQDQAATTLATLEERRLKKLLRQKSVSAESYDQAVARLQQARAASAGREAEIALLQDRIDRHLIRAPFAGVITSRWVERGSWANVGTQLMELASLQSLRLELSLPQRYYASFTRADNQRSAQVYTDELQSAIAVPVQRVLPFTNQQRNFEVWLALEQTQNNGHWRWLPGMSARATLQWQNSDDYQLSVPRDALVRDISGKAVVWKVVPASNSGDSPDAASTVWQAMPIEVSVGAGGNRRVAVRAVSANEVSTGASESASESVNASEASQGLAIGDKVVTRGNEGLRPGQTIKPLLLHEAGPH